ncbi:hypothetical protein [Agaribacter flavus]|uniref:Type II secretion system protein K n=1 Tax=Agaribacter flavus TaxID=1902781 RepID=A0ABV7FSX5_9ALTE
MNFKDIFQPQDVSRLSVQRGVVLLAVLGFLIIASILISSASVIMEERLNIATQSQQNFYNLALAHSKKAELIYLLSTQRLTVAGISQGRNPEGAITNEDGFFVNRTTGDELRVDGQVITTENSLSFAIQNMAGLIAINTSEQFWLSRYLNNSRVSSINKHRLLDSLRDYADEDDTQSAAGKEASSGYHTSNYLLQSCTELYSVAHWSAYLLTDDSLLEHCSLGRTSILNFNAVPIRLWKRLFPDSADKVQQMREKGEWLESLNSLTQMEPSIVNLQDEYYSVLGGKRFAVLVWHEGVQVKSHIQVGDNLAKPFTSKIYQ